MNIRKAFIDFFEQKQHKVYTSAPLVPNDNSLLFVNAGMVQFKDIFTGKISSSTKRATSCQLCIRAGGKHNDLENVGYTRRHHTLFEMLGNYSFGDYFKKEAIDYSFEFITTVLAFPKEKLWVTVYKDDDEAFELWLRHMPKERIKRFGEKDNFWQMGDTGACGPCSEIFYDQGAENFNSDEDYLGGEGDRFLEIWNLVFMQYERFKDGRIEPLPKPSIDTGMGLERIQAIQEGVSSNFDSSLFMPIINAIAKLLNTTYTYEEGASFRVIADHLRASIFLISDGILPEKEGRGYVLRRILRRAIRHGYLLGFKKPFLTQFVDIIIDGVSDTYTTLEQQKGYIKEHILLEEEQFFKTIDKGMKLFSEELQKLQDETNANQLTSHQLTFSGQVAFKLYDTYGFPLDLTADMLKDKNINIDMAAYDKAMSEQKALAKKSWKGSGDEALSGDFKTLIDQYGINSFIGYERQYYDNVFDGAKVSALLDEHFKITSSLPDKAKGWVLLDQTPFYAQSGGQVGDKGEIYGDNFQAKVLDTKKFFELNLSFIEVTKGSITPNERVKATIDNRLDIASNHSATHLLQSALKQVLGDNVSQAGSYNDADKLRFDFTYNKAMTNEQIDAVEDLVNQMIRQAIPQTTEVLPIEQARQKGAVAMFGEKYGDMVRVVSFGEDSIEFCGGTHTQNSSEIGSFYITKETSVSSGIRRIEALSRTKAIAYAKEHITLVKTTRHLLKNNDVVTTIQTLQKQIKQLKQSATQSANTTNLNAQEIKGISVIIAEADGDIKKIIDSHKQKHANLAIMLFKAQGDKVQVACGIQGELNISASSWLNHTAPFVDGKGGGRADFATGGGKNAKGIDKAKKEALGYLENNI